MQKKTRRFEIVAHRGIANEAPENTLASFERAIELGADAVEMDVRLTSDKVPIIYHYFMLETNTSFSGAIFNYSWSQLRKAQVYCKDSSETLIGQLSSLEEVLEAIWGGSILNCTCRDLNRKHQKPSGKHYWVFGISGILLKSHATNPLF